MKAFLRSRWVDFLIGCSMILIAYNGSPRTRTEAFIAIGGTAIGGLLLILSWVRDQQAINPQGRRSGHE